VLIGIDIGNSSIRIGYFGPDGLVVQGLPTHPLRSSQDYAVLMEDFLLQNHIEKKDIHCIISSVVPTHTGMLSSAAGQMAGGAAEPMIVSRKMDTGLCLDLNAPDSLGTDRLTNAAGARMLYKRALAVVDFGTATTVTMVNDKAALIGGAIMPGIGLMSSVLAKNTAQLPDIFPEPPERALGRDTASCIRSGIFYGTAGAVERIIAEIGAEVEAEMGGVFFMVITGGGSQAMQHYLRRPFERRPDLIFEGLRLIYEKNRS